MKVADQASKIWAQFARTGDPSVPGLVKWPRYTEAGDAYLDIGTPLAVKRGVQSAEMTLSRSLYGVRAAAVAA